MARLVLLAVAISVLCKLATGKWPWDYLKPAQTRQQAVFKARKLLGISANASREDIMLAHKRIIARVHPDRGGTNVQVHEANDARDLLLNELERVSAPGG